MTQRRANAKADKCQFLQVRKHEKLLTTGTMESPIAVSSEEEEANFIDFINTLVDEVEETTDLISQEEDSDYEYFEM